MEAVVGIFALRSLNYTNEEARDKVTSSSAIVKMRILSLIREIAANGFLRVVATPWDNERTFSYNVGLSTILTSLFGKYYSIFCLLEAMWTLRAMANNTRAYQGQEGI